MKLIVLAILLFAATVFGQTEPRFTGNGHFIGRSEIIKATIGRPTKTEIKSMIGKPIDEIRSQFGTQLNACYNCFQWLVVENNQDLLMTVYYKRLDWKVDKGLVTSVSFRNHSEITRWREIKGSLADASDSVNRHQPSYVGRSVQYSKDKQKRQQAQLDKQQKEIESLRKQVEEAKQKPADKQ